jgi:hypothetical protein
MSIFACSKTFNGARIAPREQEAAMSIIPQQYGISNEAGPIQPKPRRDIHARQVAFDGVSLSSRVIQSEATRASNFQSLLLQGNARIGRLEVVCDGDAGIGWVQHWPCDCARVRRRELEPLADAGVGRLQRDDHRPRGWERQRGREREMRFDCFDGQSGAPALSAGSV